MGGGGGGQEEGAEECQEEGELVGAAVDEEADGRISSPVPFH